MTHPCMDCGACCASFRVSFYWSETDAHPTGTVPQRLTCPISPVLVAMHGTGQRPIRCVALTGEVGKAVSCSIYALRSSTCREFAAGCDSCNKARVQHGLPALDTEPDNQQANPEHTQQTTP